MESRRGGLPMDGAGLLAPTKAPRKDVDNKRLAKFFAPDRPPRKRLRTLLDFLSTPSNHAVPATENSNMAGYYGSVINKNANGDGDNGSGNAQGANGVLGSDGLAPMSAVAEFWAETTNCSMLFGVLNDYVGELETIYSPYENAFRKIRKKTLDADDWTDLFEGLEKLIVNNVVLLHEGWNNHGFTQLFAKLLKRDNHAMIKKFAFRCLALYTDATRQVHQLSMPNALVSNGSSNSLLNGNGTLNSSNANTGATTPSSMFSRGTIGISSIGLLDTDSDSDLSAMAEDARTSFPPSNGSGAATSPLKRPNLHLDLLRESIDLSPYGGTTIALPDRFVNDGVHVEGWMRTTPTQAEEPVDMLKFIMDLSLEREDSAITTHPQINHTIRGDRFAFWTELIMKFYMPLLYPKVCIKAKLKDDTDKVGFFHHCPGTLQRVVARWIYKLRSKDECMDTLWARRDFAEVIMETVRQRFSYRDAELIQDAIKFYGGICMGTQYVPEGMKIQMNETMRAMISHVSQLFHPSVQLDDAKLLLNCIDLLELISQRTVDEYTSTYLRRFVISTIDNYVVLREPAHLPVLSAMLSVVLHVWMHAAVASKAISAPTWIELTMAMRRWLTNPNDANVVGMEVINCWKRELRFTSCLLMSVLDQGQSTLVMTHEGGIILPHSGSSGENMEMGVRQVYIQSAANFLTSTVLDVGDATILLDRVLHLIPPSTLALLIPILHFSVFEGLLQVVELWIESAICSRRSTPTALHSISPSTLIAMFGEWFLPSCEDERTEYQRSRCLAIVILCKLCSTRCINPPTTSHLTTLARVLFKAISSESGIVISTTLQKASSLFTLNLEGMNVLIPSFLLAIDQIILHDICERAEKTRTKSAIIDKELTASLDIVLSVLALPKRFPEQDFARWRKKIQRIRGASNLNAVRDLMEGIPECTDDFDVVLGRILVRIATLPFVDIISIRRRALWGLYSFIVMKLTTPDHGNADDQANLKTWIECIIDFCHSLDFSISMTALAILQDLSEYHREITELDASLVAQIVMNLGLFVHHQVEDASTAVQTAMEEMATAMDHPSMTGSDKVSITGNRPGSNRGSDPRMHRAESVEPTDAFTKLRNKLKSTPVNHVAPPTPPQQVPSPARETEIPALRLTVQKTSAIFECLRFWVMNCAEVLQVDEVKKILFSAIENALIGTLPEGDWQHELKRVHAQETPLLLLGLQMRASLNTESSQSWLKCFEETAIAAEGLLMHLLHHVNGFPSPAGVDQMISSCSEALYVGDDSNNTTAFSFVLMDSIIVTIVGSLDSPCARFIARDMTGLFTWEITPAMIMKTVDTTSGSELNKTAEKLNAYTPQPLSMKQAEAAVRVEFKSTSGSSSRKRQQTTCSTCRGEIVASRKESDQLATTDGPKLELVQMGWDQEKLILSNSKFTFKNTYVFHEDGGDVFSIQVGAGDFIPSPGPTSPNQKKKQNGPRPNDQEKMPGATAGNRDERQERLERIAKQSEERNNVGSHLPPAPLKLPPKKCECNMVETKTKSDKLTTNICGLFEMNVDEANVGSLDNERCMLDLVCDSVPMVYRDCFGDIADKTLLGGRFAMLKYNSLDLEEDSSPLTSDSTVVPGFSFLQRLIHDEECYSLLKGFLLKEGTDEGKELMEFCDSVKRYERSTIAIDRLGQANAMYWEFFTTEGGKLMQFPVPIIVDIQTSIQAALRALKSDNCEEFKLPTSLFLAAMDHVETIHLDQFGLLDRFVAALDPAGSGAPSGNSIGMVPPQLMLFDQFAIMELNARISHLALSKRNAAAAHSASKQRRATRQASGMPQSWSSRVTSLDICRLFLSQAAILPSLSGSAQDKSKVKLLDNGPKLERSLAHLDRAPVRETMKIGIVYVGSRQRGQSEILKNEMGSEAYTRFLTQLGWNVDLTTHRGFMGGLDGNPQSLSNGRTALYYANAHTEVIFHVVTHMPTRPSDGQQIDKKRHIGNDYVHIIWCENDLDGYDPTTITSHFNDVQLIISPLRRAQSGLFLVRVAAKEKVPAFGPLQTGTVVHEHDLAMLIRQTAMNANRVCRALTSMYVRPYPTRKKLVDEILERYATECNEAQLLSRLFTLAPAASPATTDG